MRDVRAIAVDVLERAAKERIFVDDALDRARGQGLSPRDRAFLTQIVLGATRHRLTLDHVAYAISGAREIDELLQHLLRVALYQVLFMRTATYAAVDAAVSMARGRARKFVNAVLRKVTREIEDFASPADDPRRLLPRPGMGPLAFKRDLFPGDAVERLAVIHSHPLWLVERWVRRWGEAAAEEILRANNTVPPLTIRARIPTDALAERLRAEGVDVRSGGRPESLRVSKTGKLSSLASFREGLFQVQDETQMGVAPLLAGAKCVVDLCAAPGGKAFHLADLGCGVIAVDISPERIRQVVDTASRVGIHFSAVIADGRRPPLRPLFDGILVDAPCSNTGVLARRADARWRLKPKDVTAMVGVQRALLEAARRLVVGGGRIVYSTCSIEPEENEGVAGSGTTTLPSEKACGGFSAVLIPGRA